mgnify:CR=1 FL=1
MQSFDRDLAIQSIKDGKTDLVAFGKPFISNPDLVERLRAHGFTLEARRVACGAGIIPAVLGGDSQPIDLGRQNRFFTTTQRAALALTYDTCAAHGCDIPFAWTETHHLHAWRDGGRTDLTNAVPLCGHHHRALDRGYTHTIRREGRRVVIHLARHRT